MSRRRSGRHQPPPRATLRTPEAWLHQLERGLRQIAQRHTLYTVFREFVELAAITVSNQVDLRNREEREQQYLRTVGKYRADEIERFCQVFAELALAIQQHPQDYLGRLRQRLELHDPGRGQAYTPWPVAEAMARMTLHDAKDVLKARPFITCLEPCAGSGVMILAVAAALEAEQLSVREQLHVTAVDVELLAVQMTYLQCTLRQIPAVVHHADSLTEHLWSTWYTPLHVADGWAGRLHSARERAAPASPAQQPPAEPPAAAVSRETPAHTGLAQQLRLF